MKWPRSWRAMVTPRSLRHSGDDSLRFRIPKDPIWPSLNSAFGHAEHYQSDYPIKLTGFGDIPAMGSAEAFINVHLQEGRDYIVYHDQVPLLNQKSEDLATTEASTANGEIILFRKVMNYHSKITEPGQNVGLG